MDRTQEWNELFATDMPTGGGQRQLVNMPLDILESWTDENGNAQPFRLFTPAQLADLAENIRRNGVIMPIRVRPRPNGRYQIIAGHNRVAASSMVGLPTIPAIVEELDDNEAKILLVDSNLMQREKLLPSERAFAYKLKLDAIKHQGKAASGQVVQKLSVETVADESGEGYKTVQRYIRLTYLILPLLERVDAGKLAMTAAVELSYLCKEVQVQLSMVLSSNSKCRVSLGAARQLRAEESSLTPERILEILGLGEQKTTAKQQILKLDLSCFQTVEIRRLQSDTGLEEWLIQQLRRYLKNETSA